MTLPSASDGLQRISIGSWLKKSFFALDVASRL
jgi:hypothetical protein